MKVRFLDKVFECEKAVKGSDFIHLYNANGGAVASFEGVSDFNLFTIEGGEWIAPEPTAEEQLRADIDFLAIMTGVAL